MTTHEDTPSLTWAPVSEAADTCGVSVGAIRKWAARDMVRSRTGQGPRGERLEVAVEDVQERAEVVAPESRSTDLQPLVEVQRVTAEQFAHLGGLIHRAGQDVAEWRARAEVAETRLSLIETARGDIEGLRDENVKLRAQLDDAHERIVQLEQALRTATRPLFGRRHHR